MDIFRKNLIIASTPPARLSQTQLSFHMDLIFRSPNTHLYPGLKGKLDGGSSPDPGDAVRCLVEFSDGNVVPSFLEKLETDRWKLTVDGHITTAGTPISQKSWAVRIEKGEDGSRQFGISRLNA